MPKLFQILLLLVMCSYITSESFRFVWNVHLSFSRSATTEALLSVSGANIIRQKVSVCACVYAMAAASWEQSTSGFSCVNAQLIDHGLTE